MAIYYDARVFSICLSKTKTENFQYRPLLISTDIYTYTNGLSLLKHCLVVTVLMIIFQIAVLLLLTMNVVMSHVQYIACYVYRIGY